jgi:hypothetical protein
MLALAFIAVAQTVVGWLSLAGALFLGWTARPWWAALLVACVGASAHANALNQSRPPETLFALFLVFAIVFGAGWLVGRWVGRA